MWISPLPTMTLRLTSDSESFLKMPDGETGLPVLPHPGAFGFVRRNHTHEGVDLYAPEGTPVHAVEDGIVVAVVKFTGADAAPPSPWWHNTDAVMVEGQSGVVLYGEIKSTVAVDDLVKAGMLIGHITPVLIKDKGRPMSMLHLELHQPGTRDTHEWTVGGERPATLLDPTEYLGECL